MRKRIYLTIEETQEEQNIINFCKQKIKECRIRKNIPVLVQCTTTTQKQFIDLVEQYIALVDETELQRNIKQFQRMIENLKNKN